jgi:hypothetical protein
VGRGITSRYCEEETADHILAKLRSGWLSLHNKVTEVGI